MRRILESLAIFVLFAVAVTAVLALTTAGDRIAELADEPPTPAGAAASAGAEALPSAPETPPPAPNALPDHLAASAGEAQVLGVTITQETGPDMLAETGVTLPLQLFVIAAAVIAVGGVVRGAGRDHARGELTLMG